jgi:hypothetical protein
MLWGAFPDWLFPVGMWPHGADSEWSGNMIIGQVTNDSITLSWDPLSGAQLYEVYRDTSLDGSYVTCIYAGNALAYVDEGLQPFTYYYYKIRAYIAGSYTILSDAVAARTGAVTPSPAPIPTPTTGIKYGSSWVELCNRALARLGKERISSLTSGGDEVALCNTLLGEAIEAVYSATNWNAAKVRAHLARLETTPIFGLSYLYALPVDFVIPCEVEVGGEEYRIEKDGILTNAEDVYLTYVARPSDPTFIPGYLKKAITTHLAFLLSSSLTADDALAARIIQEAGAAIDEAIRDDGRRSAENPRVPFFDEAR